MMGHTDKYINLEKIAVYGHAYCPGARRLRTALDDRKVTYEWRDIREGDPRFENQLKELANGYLSVPTLIFPDGTLMVEPLLNEVLNKLNIE
jgi:hypothetical protein